MPCRRRDLQARGAPGPPVRSRSCRQAHTRTDKSLRPERGGIWDASGDIQLGFVPGDQSARVASDMRAGTQLVGFILREFRRGKEGPRLGIHVLVVPSGTLELVVESPDDD